MSKANLLSKIIMVLDYLMIVFGVLFTIFGIFSSREYGYPMLVGLVPATVAVVSLLCLRALKSQAGVIHLIGLGLYFLLYVFSYSAILWSKGPLDLFVFFIYSYGYGVIYMLIILGYVIYRRKRPLS